MCAYEACATRERACAYDGARITVKASAVAAVTEKYTMRCGSPMQEEALKRANELIQSIEAFNAWVKEHTSTSSVTGMDARDIGWERSIVHAHAMTGKLEVNAQSVKRLR